MDAGVGEVDACAIRGGVSGQRIEHDVLKENGDSSAFDLSGLLNHGRAVTNVLHSQGAI